LDKAPDAFRTISEVADDLKVPQHVLRFWESRFSQIKPMKRAGGRRYYRPDDVDLLRGIHHLLYGEGYTIRGVQRILKDQGIKFVENVWQAGAEQPPHGPHHDGDDADTHEDKAPRGRLFERLQSLTGRDHAPRHEPAMDHEASAHADNGRADLGHADSGHADLSRDELRKLQTTLFELGECRRLLDAALTRKDD
jgi:DNA-binding transcriptional MerR regulator